MINPGVFVAIGGLALALTLTTAPATPSIDFDEDFDLSLRSCQDGSSHVVSNDGDGLLVRNPPTGRVWLAVAPSSGSNLPGLEDATAVTTSVDRTGLDPENHAGPIYVSGNDPQEIETVVMDVQQTRTLEVGPSAAGLSRPWRSERVTRQAP